MKKITVIPQVDNHPVFHVPSELDALFLRYKGQDYCLTDGRDNGPYIVWFSTPVSKDYCPHIHRIIVE